ncbi:toprim domain-containing protein [Francisella philomiragia]|uniref:Toprim domain protein n=1 Tax=Francisella philomiragia TaxID=28110 RepID=A0A0B6D580_9GAMM|nr:toprim domain-containing protein [Francisella philomiragia]AJI54041.1 toprim domain protein [Francisella philomiragia]MBY7734797.1 toprim domain-containing protein [Francisella philomiragia]
MSDLKNFLDSNKYSLRYGEITRFRDPFKSKDNRDIWATQIDWNTYIMGNWSTGEKVVISEEKTISYAEKAEYAYRSLVAEQEAENKKKDVATKVKTIFEMADDASNDHPYLLRKGIDPVDIKQINDMLIIPIYSIGDIVPADELQSIQFIYPDGSKRFAKGGISKGYMLLDNGSTSMFVICEGYATGVSILEHLKQNQITASVIVAFNCHNLLDVGKYIRENFRSSNIEIWADNDASGIGEIKAKEVQEIVGATIKIPPFNEFEKSQGLTDWNDYFNQQNKHNEVHTHV